MEFAWEELEYQYTHKESRWFWIVGLGGLVILLLSVLMKNFLLAVLVLLATFALLLHGHRRPERISFIINRRGIQVRHIFYSFKHLHSFWVHDHLPIKKITLRSEKAFMPHLHLPLPEDLDHKEIRLFLLEYLPEEHHEPTLIDALAEYL